MLQNECNIHSFIARTSNAVDSMALSRKAAEVIICVAFNAVNAKEISRSQLSAATKPLTPKFKLSLSKEEYLKPVANGLVKAGYVKLTKELSHDTVIVCDDIILLRTFAPIAIAHLYCARYSLRTHVPRHFQARALSRKLNNT